MKVDGARIDDRFYVVQPGEAPFVLQVGRRALRVSLRPLSTGDGVSPESLREAERRLGVELPLASGLDVSAIVRADTSPLRGRSDGEWAVCGTSSFFRCVNVAMTNLDDVGRT